MTNYRATGNQRTPAPESMLAFAGAMYAPSLAAIPCQCRCIWVPAWKIVFRNVTTASGRTSTVLCYQADGFLRKFPDRDCPERHQAR